VPLGADLDILSLEKSVARSRTLAFKALEVGKLAERIEALERLVAPSLEKAGRRR